MPSTTTNNNSTSSSQSAQFSFSGANSGLASLGSLASAIEPNGFQFNPQQTSVGTFPQRPTGGAPPVCFCLYLHNFIDFCLFFRIIQDLHLVVRSHHNHLHLDRFHHFHSQTHQQQMLLRFLFQINRHQILLVFLLQIHNKEILKIFNLIHQQIIHKSNNQYHHLPLHHQHKTKEYQITINNFHHRLQLRQLIVQNRDRHQAKR
jgi:hypothetical protein